MNILSGQECDLIVDLLEELSNGKFTDKTTKLLCMNIIHKIKYQEEPVSVYPDSFTSEQEAIISEDLKN